MGALKLKKSFYPGVVIRGRTEPPERKWTQERQVEGITAFLKSVDNYTDEERNLIPDAEEFHKQYGLRFRQNNPPLFDIDGLRLNNWRG